jgi:hypothetical protein
LGGIDHQNIVIPCPNNKNYRYLAVGFGMLIGALVLYTVLNSDIKFFGKKKRYYEGI